MVMFRLSGSRFSGPRRNAVGHCLCGARYHRPACSRFPHGVACFHNRSQQFVLGRFRLVPRSVTKSVEQLRVLARAVVSMDSALMRLLVSESSPPLYLVGRVAVPFFGFGLGEQIWLLHVAVFVEEEIQLDAELTAAVAAPVSGAVLPSPVCGGRMVIPAPGPPYDVKGAQLVRLANSTPSWWHSRFAKWRLASRPSATLQDHKHSWFRWFIGTPRVTPGLVAHQRFAVDGHCVGSG